jgi:hypothetical protein
VRKSPDAMFQRILHGGQTRFRLERAVRSPCERLGPVPFWNCRMRVSAQGGFASKMSLRPESTHAGSDSIRRSFATKLDWTAPVHPSKILLPGCLRRPKFVRFTGFGHR